MQLKVIVKKYPDRKNALSGRVIIKESEALWYLVEVDDAGVHYWLRVDAKNDGTQLSYVGRVPQETKLSNVMLDGERVVYPKSERRY